MDTPSGSASSRAGRGVGGPPGSGLLWCALAVALSGAIGACERSTPSEPDSNDGPRWIDVALGRAHTCAVRSDGAVFCWGENQGHQVSSQEVGQFTVPQPVGLARPAASVSLGNDGSCALEGDGTAWCWGRNFVGQLAVPGDTLLEEPTELPMRFDVLRLGAIHSCGTRSGGAWCWGGTADGPGREMGLGSPLDETCPRRDNYHSTSCAPTPRAVSLPENAVDVAPGIFYSCARTVSGRVYCWGHHRWGQLGDGVPLSADSSEWGRFEAAEVAGSRRFGALSVGNLFACGTESGGAAFCWGVDFGTANHAFSLGQLGRGLPPNTNGTRAPAPVVGGHGFSRLVTNDENSIWAALTCGISEGALLCWGSNEYGQLGVGATPLQNCGLSSGRPCQSTPTLVDPGPFTDLDIGMYHTCALRADGSLLCWGRNEFGQLGLGDTTDRSVPVEVPVPDS